MPPLLARRQPVTNVRDAFSPRSRLAEGGELLPWRGRINFAEYAPEPPYVHLGSPL